MTCKILTIGTFDILHFGHISFLQRCTQLLTSPIEFVVGVNTDAFASTFKPAPIMNFYERIYAIQQLGYTVVPNDSPGRDLIESQEPNLLIAGSDWADKNYLDQIDVTVQWLDDHNVTLLFLNRVHGLAMATSEIKQRVIDRARREATPEDFETKHLNCWIREKPKSPPQDLEPWMNKDTWMGTL